MAGKSDKGGKSGDQGSSYEFEQLMQARMAEMGAVIDTIVGKAGSFQDDARKHVEKAVKDMEAQRATFQKQADDMRDATEDAWSRSVQEAEKLWKQFEDSASDAAKKFNAESETYRARAEASLKSWKETADWFADQAETMAKRSQKELEKMAKGMASGDPAAAIRGSGDAAFAAWQAMADGFENAWKELEKASKSAAEAYKTTRKK